MSPMIRYPFMEALRRRHFNLRRDLETSMYSLAPQRTPFQNMVGGAFGLRQGLGAAGALGLSTEQRLAMQNNLTAQYRYRPEEPKPHVHLRDRKAPPWPVDWWLE